ncbi:MAG: hypothetical protein ACK4SY_10455, partial [Pyrobaculum sp.]
GGAADVYIYEVPDDGPYDRQVMGNTRGLMSGLSWLTQPGVGAIDSVYTEAVVKNLGARGESLYLATMEYLQDLHLFATPPEDTAYLRPSFYIDVYLVDSTGEMALGELQRSRVRLSISEIGASSGEKRLAALVESCDVYYISRIEGERVLIEKDERKGVNRVYRRGYAVLKCGDVYDDGGLAVERLDVGEPAAAAARPRKRRKT